MRYSTREFVHLGPHSKAQSTYPLICRHETEGNGTEQDKRADHRADLSLARSTHNVVEHGELDLWASLPTW